MWNSDGWQSAISFTHAVSGTASSTPMIPQSQPQKSIPIVAATGPIFTREPMNLGTRKLAETIWSAMATTAMMMNGAGESN